MLMRFSVETADIGSSEYIARSLKSNIYLSILMEPALAGGAEYEKLS